MWQELPEIIKHHRKQSGLSQEALADLCGVGKTTIFDLENRRSNARLETIQKILRVLNIEIRFFSPLMDDFKQQKD